MWHWQICQVTWGCQSSTFWRKSTFLRAFCFLEMIFCCFCFFKSREKNYWSPILPLLGEFKELRTVNSHWRLGLPMCALRVCASSVYGQSLKASYLHSVQWLAAGCCARKGHPTTFQLVVALIWYVTGQAASGSCYRAGCLEEWEGKVVVKQQDGGWAQSDRKNTALGSALIQVIANQTPAFVPSSLSPCSQHCHAYTYSWPQIRISNSCTVPLLNIKPKTCW